MMTNDGLGYMKRNEDCSSKSQISDQDVEKAQGCGEGIRRGEAGALTNRSHVAPEKSKK